MNPTTTRLITALQEGVPLEKRPFKALGEAVGVGGEELLSITSGLKKSKIIRQISPIYDTRMLGYDSAVVAFKVRTKDIEEAAHAINAHPGVSHNYERVHEFNLWFTLAAAPDGALTLDETVCVLADEARALDYAILRPKRVFKISVKFDPSGKGLDKEEAKTESHAATPLTDDDKKIIRVTQADMPLTTRPFALYADELGMAEDLLIEKLREFKDRGVMRRFAAILNHRKVGFSANAMAVWKAPEDSVEEAGAKMAAFKAVTHCYERHLGGGWRYNLFSMVHGRSAGEVEKIIEEIRKETALEDFTTLYTAREFKKIRLNYFTRDFYDWEEARMPLPRLAL